MNLPSRDGVRRYTHLIRSPYDPEETKARGSGKRDPTHWMKSKIPGVETWKRRIATLLSDGEPRTFNAICVELTGTTADVWFDKAPDQALWSLVEAQDVAWACEENCVFFITTKAVDWDWGPLFEVRRE